MAATESGSGSGSEPGAGSRSGSLRQPTERGVRRALWALWAVYVLGVTLATLAEVVTSLAVVSTGSHAFLASFVVLVGATVAVFGTDRREGDVASRGRGGDGPADR